MATQLPDDLIAIITLWLTFSGTLCPFEWGITLETVCDLANKLLKCKDWEPQDLHASVQMNIPPRKYLSNDIPFAIGCNLIVDIPIDPWGYADVYINNMTGLTVDLPGTMNANQLWAAMPMAIKVAAWPNNANEPFPCKKMIAEDKLTVEGGLSEKKLFSDDILTSEHLPWPSQNTNTLRDCRRSNWWSRRPKQQRKHRNWWLDAWTTSALWFPGSNPCSAASDHCSRALGTGWP